MDNPASKKLFSAELQRLRTRGLPAPLPAAPVSAPGQSPEILSAIQALRNDVHGLEQILRKQFEPPTAAAAEDEAELRRSENKLLRNEIRAMSLAIQHTKSEIAALRPPNAKDDRLVVVTQELDAIVTATESATNAILESAEKIDGLAEHIQSPGGEAIASQTASDIREIVIGMFEACNFQDITGQRISKVVKTLQFIEERVNKMIEIWGPETFDDLPPPPEVEKEGEDRLLNGPALENQGVSQADIDKLFG